MKSDVPWQVEGVRRQARETAREAARRSGMSVGEWPRHRHPRSGIARRRGAPDSLPNCSTTPTTIRAPTATRPLIATRSFIGTTSPIVTKTCGQGAANMPTTATVMVGHPTTTVRPRSDMWIIPMRPVMRRVRVRSLMSVPTIKPAPRTTIFRPPTESVNVPTPLLVRTRWRAPRNAILPPTLSSADLPTLSPATRIRLARTNAEPGHDDARHRAAERAERLLPGARRGLSPGGGSLRRAQRSSRQLDRSSANS